jgi:hypothetical protein
MRQCQRIATAIGAVAALACTAATAGLMDKLVRSLDPELGTLEARLAAIAEELTTLPPPPRALNTFQQGFVMTPALPGTDPPWLEISFPEPRRVDTVVLFPQVIAGTDRPIEGFGFPQRFRLVADAGEAATRLVVADMSQADVPNPGITPVIIPGPHREVSSIRLEVVKSWQDDTMTTLGMAEIMLLDGNRNAAVGGTVTVSRPQGNPVLTEAHVIDMRTPQGLPVVGPASGSFGYQSRAELRRLTPKAITIDLGEPGTIDEIRLVPVSREGRRSYASFGFPQHFTVHVATTPDFAAAVLLTPSPQPPQVAPDDNLVIVPCRDPQPYRYLWNGSP